MSAIPTTKVFRASMPEPRMICTPDTIMKLVTKMRMAPMTGAGITENRPLILGKKPKATKSVPAAKPM